MLGRWRRWRFETAWNDVSCGDGAAGARASQTHPAARDRQRRRSRPARPSRENAASEQYRSAERIIQQPYARPGEYLEATPGLIVTQHSGEGKANQYFLRGFNLDHGTDLAITVDGMPVNMRTHGHGQGYADLSFLIPELISSMRIRKGPYFADEGDFSSAGALHIDYIDTLNPGLAAGHLRHVQLRPRACDQVGAAGSRQPAVAGEGIVYDGPWVVPDGMRKAQRRHPLQPGHRARRLLHHRHGLHQPLDLDRPGRQARHRSGDHRPVRHARSDRRRPVEPLQPLGSLERCSNDWGVTRLEAYAIRYTMALFNNFTYFLDDPSQRRPVQPARQPHGLRLPRQPHLQGATRPVRVSETRVGAAGPLRRYRRGLAQDPASA